MRFRIDIRARSELSGIEMLVGASAALPRFYGAGAEGVLKLLCCFAQRIPQTPDVLLGH